jgi:hypothetical protein
LLALIIYLTTNSLLKGEELITITYKNIRDNIRNIILNKEKELILIITNYYKSYNITRKEKENLRFLNKDFNIILIYYLVYIIPLYYYFNIKYLRLTSISPYLLENKGVTINSTSLSNTLFKMSSLYFREGLTINSYRHLINYIIKEKLNYIINLKEEDNIIDLLANKSFKVSNLNYLRDLNLRSSTIKDIYNKALKLCLNYFKFFNIKKDNLINNNNLAKILLLFKVSSISINNNSNNILNTLNSFKSFNNLKLKEYLRSFFNNSNATFKDTYIIKALDLILNNKDLYIIYINKTGSGKSLLFLLPSFINFKIVNIVLTPRVSLKDNLYKRVKEKRLEVYILEDIIIEDINFITLRLIISNIDNILNTSFNTYINLLKKNNIEIKLYLNEIHALLLEFTFKPILKYLNSLLKFKILIIFISATLLNSLLNILNKEFFLNLKIIK